MKTPFVLGYLSDEMDNLIHMGTSHPTPPQSENPHEGREQVSLDHSCAASAWHRVSAT